MKIYQGKIDNFGDAFKAYAIGAVAGAVGAATGGAAFTALGGPNVTFNLKFAYYFIDEVAVVKITIK